MASFKDLEMEVNSLLARPVESAAQTRWERKAMQSVGNTTPSVKSAHKTPSRSGGSSSTKTPGSSNTKSGTKSGKKTPGSSKGKASYGDRFIPNREAMNSNLHAAVANNENVAPEVKQDFCKSLAQSLLGGDEANAKILAFKNKPPAPSVDFHNKLRVVYTQNKETNVPKKQRHIKSTPDRILDAPDLQDDYYLNLLDWSSNDTMAIGLGASIYLWNSSTGVAEEMTDGKVDEENKVCSVSFMQDGTHLAVGMENSDVLLYNLERKKLVRTMKGHRARVSSLSWNNAVVSSGSRDSKILHHDVRLPQSVIATLSHHEQEVCGLKWSPDGTQLASGGNDNLCLIWDAGKTAPRHIFADACAGVKALAWCPWQSNILATGAGTADRQMRFYNTQHGSMINSIDTQSQVCSLVWSTHEKEILSSHGFSQNQLSVWKWPTLAKVADLTGHSSRVLHTALSADGTTVCSAAADETLRFWHVWDQPVKQKAKEAEQVAALTGRSSSVLAMTLR